MFVANRYRLYPNADQQVLLAKHFGCCRWLYNKGLAMKTEAWTERKENLSRFDIQKNLPTWKKTEDTAWLAEVNSQSLQSSLVNLEMAYTRFFKLKKGFPRFKSKHDNRQSFQVPQLGEVGSDFVKIPKLGRIKAVISRECVGKIKTITISRTPTGKYFASVLCDDGKELPPKIPVTEDGTLGIDLGIKDFAVLSNGVRIANPRNVKWASRKLARAQRRLSRRVKGSKNRDKQRTRVARCHEQVANRRKDFLHKLTTKLVRDNQTDSFAIEDLAVRNMMQNPRLAKAIADVSWGEFRRQLEYKAERAGKNVLVIGRFEPSSKTCSCGVVNDKLKLSDRVWTCSCGTTHDRDLLAANNIKRFALHPRNKLVAGDTGESTPVETGNSRSSKQESKSAVKCARGESASL
jgi:putative transposase